MEDEERSVVERMEAATALLERTLNWLEERQGVGEVEKISATVELSSSIEAAVSSSATIICL